MLRPKRAGFTVYCASAYEPSSRPMPDCFLPPEEE